MFEKEMRLAAGIMRRQIEHLNRENAAKGLAARRSNVAAYLKMLRAQRQADREEVRRLRKLLSRTAGRVQALEVELRTAQDDRDQLQRICGALRGQA